MTTTSMNMLDLIRKSQTDGADIDFLREGVAMLAQAMMEVDVTAQVGAALGEHAPDPRTTTATATGRDGGTPARARSTWPSPSCVPATTSRTSCSNRGSTETGSSWTAFLRGLVARGLSGVQLVTSDAHGGIIDAIAAVLDGAQWQRCRTHFTRNLLDRVPAHAQDLVGSLVRSMFNHQLPAKEVWSQHARVVAKLESSFPDAAEMLDEAAPDILAFTAYPQAAWRRVWSNNPQERLNREVRRRTDVVGIFPNRPSVIRLVGAVLAEQHDEWQIGRRYMNESTIRDTLIRPGDDQPADPLDASLPALDHVLRLTS